MKEPIKVKYRKLKNTILNRRINSIFKKFKLSVESYTQTLKIEENIKKIVEKNSKTFSNKEAWGDYFAAIHSYYRRNYGHIINQAAWVLKLYLESENSPPIKPKYQFLFRSFVHTHITGLTNNAIDRIVPILEAYGMDTSDTGIKLDIQVEVFKIMYDQYSVIDTSFTNVFNNYNVTVRPFKDSVRSYWAIIISIIAIVVTIWINFRNEIWNFFSKLFN